MVELDITKLIENAKKNWYSCYGLIISLIITILIGLLVVYVINPDIYIKIIIIIIFILVTIFLWIYTIRIPRTKKDKIGFLISINAEKESQRKKIKQDFILVIHELIKGGESGKTFQVIEMPEHIAEKIVDMDSAQHYKKKCRAHFMIFGRIRLRILGGKEVNIINLEGIVSHSPIEKKISDQISREFSELLPRRMRIATENDVLTFDFTSEWISCVAKYIIGIAAAISGDLNYAEKLYKEVQINLERQNHNFPIYNKIRQRIPLRLAEIYQAYANIHYNRWVKNKDITEIERMGFYLDNVPSQEVEKYGILLLKVIYNFLNDRNINECIRLSKKCKKVQDSIWHYNLGFLYGYKGDLKKAIQQYNKALYEVEPKVIAEIEEFICWLLEEEQDKYQLYYCLGYFNWKIKGDYKQSIEDFQTFLSKRNEDEFIKESELAEKWIYEIRSKLL